MITQIAHLTLSTPSFETHRALFKRLGFTERFVERDCPNPEIKRPFVYRFEPLHDIALFDAPNSLSIELVRQGNHDNSASLMVPIFENLPFPHVMRGSEVVTLIDGTTACEAKIDGLDVPVFVRMVEMEGSCKFQSCVVRVQELSKSLVMWASLGCTLITRNEKQALLLFSSPILPFEARFYLVETPTESRLDSYGFNYIAFVASSVSQERERLLNKGFSPTQICTMTVNGKKLELFFLPEGIIAPIEIFGVQW